MSSAPFDNTGLHFQPNDENPYAWDSPHPGDNNHSVLVYNSVAGLDAMARVSYMVSGALGGLLNGALLDLVLRQSRGELRPYARMLLLTCLCDIAFWLADSCAEFKARINEGVFLVEITGIARHLPYAGKLTVTATFVAALSLACTILPAQFFFRLQAVKGNVPTVGQTLLLFLASFLAAFSIGAISWPSYRFSGRARPAFNYAQLWYEQRPVPQLIIGDLRDFMMNVYFCWVGVVITIAYLLTAWLGWRTVRELRAQDQHFTERTRQMQRQLNRALLVQSLLPLGVSVGPVLGLVIPALLHWDGGAHAFIICLLFSYVPLLNPLCTMLLIGPYRRSVRRLLHSAFCCWRRSVQPHSLSSGGSGAQPGAALIHKPGAPSADPLPLDSGTR